MAMPKEQLISFVVKNYPGIDLGLLDKAFKIVNEKLRGQKRGDLDYVDHPIQTALLIAEMKLDIASVITALLHDLPAHSDYGLADVKRDFGAEVHHLMEGLENLSQIDERYQGSERYVANAQRMFVALAKDFRVLLIKFSERLNNLQHLETFPGARQRKMIETTERVYIPLAGILGIWQIRSKMEDICFAYRQPLMHQKIERKIAKGVGTSEQQKQMKKFQTQVEKSLHQAGLDCVVSSRIKNISAIYHKMLDKQKRFHEIYDVFAIRVVVPTISDCYLALGLIHQLWQPVKERIKDYIAQPKPNGYQSLHTTVVNSDGYPMEFQIRTQEMHDVAQYGLAAHWYYKRLITKGQPLQSWISQLVKLRQDYENAGQLPDDPVLDLLADRIFVYSPKGDIIELPRGSTPLDFAYAIHTDVGHHAIRAVVNGQPQKLVYKLHNNDVIEIITDRRKKPAKSWLRFIKTPQARNALKKFFR